MIVAERPHRGPEPDLFGAPGGLADDELGRTLVLGKPDFVEAQAVGDLGLVNILVPGVPDDAVGAAVVGKEAEFHGYSILAWTVPLFQREIERVRKPGTCCSGGRLGESVGGRQVAAAGGCHAVWQTGALRDVDLMLERDFLPGARRFQHRQTYFHGGAAPDTVVARRPAFDDRGIKLINRLGARHCGRRQRVEPSPVTLVAHDYVWNRPE